MRCRPLSLTRFQENYHQLARQIAVSAERYIDKAIDGEKRGDVDDLIYLFGRPKEDEHNANVIENMSVVLVNGFMATFMLGLISIVPLVDTRGGRGTYARRPHSLRMRRRHPLVPSQLHAVYVRRRRGTPRWAPHVFPGSSGSSRTRAFERCISALFKFW